MEGVKYINLIEIGIAVIKIRGVENGKLAVPVNNTIVPHTAFLAANTWLYVLIYSTEISKHTCPVHAHTHTHTHTHTHAHNH